MFGFLLGFTSVYALLRVNRKDLRGGTVNVVSELLRVAETVQSEAERIAGGMMEEVQDILAEARFRHEEQKAAATRAAADQRSSNGSATAS